MSVRADAAAIGPDLAELRRRIHQDPEIGLDLPRTQAKVLAALDGLPLEVTRGRALSSVTGVLRAAAPGPRCCCAATWTRCRSPSGPGCPTPPP